MLFQGPIASSLALASSEAPVPSRSRRGGTARARAAFVIILLSFGRAAAQDASPPPASADRAPAQEEKREGRGRFFDPQDGQLDLSYFLETVHGFLPIPIIVTEPAVGYGGGGAGMFIRPRREAGEEGWARPDISAAGGIVTRNGTWAAFGGDSSRWLDGRLRTLAGGGTGQINLDFYGLGLDCSSFDEKVRYTLQFTGAVVQGNWQLAPKSPWSVGMRYVFADVEPKLRDTPAFPGLVDRVHVRVSAPTAVLEYDSRDNIFTPTRGLYSETSYLASRESFGANVDFERFQQVLIGWHALRHDLILGARGDFGWASDDTPFFLRPFILLRGVPAVRYQGDRMASAEAELRWQFYGRWSAVAFAGVGTTRTRRDDFAITQNVGSGGVGLRYELARKFGLHVGLDVAHSPGTTGVYLQIGNAWFRP